MMFLRLKGITPAGLIPLTGQDCRDMTALSDRGLRGQTRGGFRIVSRSGHFTNPISTVASATV